MRALRDAYAILNEYSQPHIDIGNVYFAATTFRSEYEKMKNKVDWYEAPEQVKYVARMYAELSLDDQTKIDNLMKALADMRVEPPERDKR